MKLTDRLTEQFGRGPAMLVRAPGRVNLIGDHTDYNGGYVLPMAVNLGIHIAFRPSGDARVELQSLDFNESAAFSLDAIRKGDGPGWAQYAMGVADEMQKAGYKVEGLKGVMSGDLPIGAGMSSSAAFEAAIAMALCEVSGLKINREKLARLCQKAENEFVGMKCGIMDQFACLLSRKGSALFIDCTTLNYDLAPLDPAKALVIVCDTGVKRQLVSSAYNDRRNECIEAFRILKQHMPEIKTYKDLSVQAFKAFSYDLPEALEKRARHVVTENGRVLFAVKALQRGDMIGFGTAMDASHESLRTDFEVSGPELDIMVRIARETSGTFGARMTGAGFGGCAVALVRPDAAAEFIQAVPARYRKETGREARVFACQPSDGATLENGTAA